MRLIVPERRIIRPQLRRLPPELRRCGHVYKTSGVESFSITASAQAAALSSISPTTVETGIPFTLTVNGAGFLTSSIIRINGVALTTTFNSSVLLTATVAGSDIATEGSYTIDVSQGGLISNTQTLTVDDDLHFSSVTFLLHCDGTNGSTTFTDTSGTPKTVTAVGNAQVSTTDPKFGTGALLLDGTGDNLSVAHNSALSCDSADFTVEGWAKFTTKTNSAQLIEKSGTVGSSFPNWSLELDSTATKLKGNVCSTGSPGTVRGTVTSTTTIPTGTWFHFAMVKDGSTLRLFYNGVQESTAAISGTPSDGAAGAMLLGFQASGTGAMYMNGRLDDVRITKGYARYGAAGFVPLSNAYPDS